MRVLALDTATEACSVALLTDAGLIGRFREMPRGHAEEVLGMVDAVLAEAGCTLSSLDGIAASIGPGAFTGVRIAVSVAQGLAFGAGLPAVGVSTLEALAAQAQRGGAEVVLACLDARMGEVYFGWFGADARYGVVALAPPAVGNPQSLTVPPGLAGQVIHGIGRGFRAYSILSALPGLVLRPGASEALPDARDMARLGAQRLMLGAGVDPADLTPLYLRDKVALTELERRAQRPAPE